MHPLRRPQPSQVDELRTWAGGARAERNAVLAARRTRVCVDTESHRCHVWPRPGVTRTLPLDGEPAPAHLPSPPCR
jgi:hypothetical protein